jgi:cation diffusion facilitator CzcD-associated flavoprotein CzcO
VARTAERRVRIAIIGSGFSGLCLAIRLKQSGVDSFTIFEKAERLGGTWRENSYPGSACDLMSFAYCYSFEQKTDWSRKWSPQPEILDYMDHCAEKYGILPHVRFGSEVASARFDAGSGVWRLETADGESFEAEVLVSGVGQLHRPQVPELPGLERFHGPTFHSARWDHGLDLDGKTVAVVGNAASAIQFIPQIAPQVAKLHVFQRSANWMLPRNDRAYREDEKRRFRRYPWLAKLYRWFIWSRQELLMYPVIRRNRFLSSRAESAAQEYLNGVIRDPELRRALTPDYPIGGKRILISDDYYPALTRDNVEVVTGGIDHFEEGAVVGADGSRREVDVVIFATGFETTSFLAPMQIEGLDGRSLRREWGDSPRAYLGLTVSGYPNFFMMYGPNTNLGHNSIIFMIECQTRYILDAVRALREEDLAYLDLRPEVLEAYNVRLQEELAKTAWAATGKSWYKTAAGEITNNWSGSTAEYWWRTRRFDRGAYRGATRTAVVPLADEVAVASPTPAA